MAGRYLPAIFLCLLISLLHILELFKEKNLEQLYGFSVIYLNVKVI
jgi:hypothetical protein